MDEIVPKQPYYHYKVRVGIFVANVQAHTWQEAIDKCMKANLFDKHDKDGSIKCIEVRRIRGKDDDAISTHQAHD
jgi:hypothetical protein